MFAKCNEFNSPVTFGNNVQNASHMFQSTWAFNRDLLFPASIRNVSLMLANDVRAFKNRNIYFENSSTLTKTNTWAMIASTKVTNINIYCDNAEPFIGNVSSNSIMNFECTWTPMEDGNGYSCNIRNLRVYNNWTPT